MFFQKRRHFQVPTRFPAAFSFENKGTGEVTDLLIADAAAWAAICRNVGQLDPGKVMARKAELGGQPFSAEDFATSLKDGAELRGELADDGGQETCGFCLQVFQPKVIPWANRETGETGEGGNFLILKAAQIAALTKKLNDAGLAAKVSGIAAAATAAIMGGAEVPSLAVALPVCRDCREARKRAGFMERYYSRASAWEALPSVDIKIGVAVNRAAISEALGGRQFRPQRAVGGGVRPDDRRGYRNGQREEFVNFDGASLLSKTVAALQAAGCSTAKAALNLLRNTSIAELEARGIAHGGSHQAITRQLERAVGDTSNGRPVAGSASAVVAPGAPRPGSQSPRPTRPRQVTVSTTPPKGGGGKGRSRAAGVGPSEALG
jgi:hypothetical protein